MRKGLVIIVLALLLSIPIASAGNQSQKCSVEIDDTTIIRCIVNGESLEKKMSVSTIQDLVDLGASYQEDFLTIYDKTKSDEEVTVAFENIEPFFQALIDSELTNKTVDELNTLYYGIREKIREPRRQPVWKSQDVDSGARPLGIWNGLPTPIWANVVCGIFDAGICAGFAFGTHTIIPTIGADAFITYGFQGTSITVGGFGGTMAFSAFQVIFVFVGILLALPLIMLGPYFMTGLCGGMIGIGV
jgi:hypothetical protein